MMNRNRGCVLIGCGVLVSLGVCLPIIGVVLWFSMPTGSSLGTFFSSLQTISELGTRQVQGSVIPLTPGGDGQPADLLIENWQLDAPLTDLPEQAGIGAIPIFLSATYEEDGRRLVRWETIVGTSDNSLAHNVAFDKSNVYVSAGTRLQALARETGDVIWETTLSDFVEAVCRDCIQVVNGRLVILSTDQVLHGLDVATGESVWQVRLNEDAAVGSSSGIVGYSVAGDQVVVIDAIEGDPSRKEARFYSAADGTVTGELRPVCTDPGEFFQDTELDRTDPVLVGGRKGQITFIIESITFAPCIQSWDVTSGELVWEARLPEGAGLTLAVPPSLLNTLSGPFFVMGADALYLSAEPGAGDHAATTFRVDLDTGRLDPLAAADDYAITPLGEQGDVLVVRATRTRGSARTELWGLDNSSGSRLWRHELQAGLLLDVESGFGEDWTYRLTPQGLVVIQLLVDPDRLVVQKIDVATGQVVVGTISEVDDDFWTGVAWTDRSAYLTLRSLYRADLKTGIARLNWP